MVPVTMEDKPKVEKIAFIYHNVTVEVFEEWNKLAGSFFQGKPIPKEYQIKRNLPSFKQNK